MDYKDVYMWIDGSTDMSWTPWYEALKPLLNKWKGILKIELNEENEPVLKDECLGTAFKIEMLVDVYRDDPDLMTRELEDTLITEHKMHNLPIPEDA